jgi:hypothetical protein
MEISMFVKYVQTSGRKKYIQLPPKSKQLQFIISWVPNELGKRRFRHLTQHGHDFFEIQYQILATLVCLLPPKSQHFHGSFFR